MLVGCQAQTCLRCHGSRAEQGRQAHVKAISDESGCGTRGWTVLETTRTSPAPIRAVGWTTYASAHLSRHGQADKPSKVCARKVYFSFNMFCTGRVSIPRDTHVRHTGKSFQFSCFMPVTYSDYYVRIITSVRWWKRMQLWIQLKYLLLPSPVRRWRPLLLPERSQRDLSPWYSLSSKSDLLTLLSWTEWVSVICSTLDSIYPT